MHVAEGLLRGVRRDGIDRYYGIPYAAPPLGERRWRPPAPPAAWRGVRAADAPPPSCVQRTGAGQEDCLYLSVLRPARPRHGGPLPVIFYIHGGGFTGGSGLDNDPSRLIVDGDVIVVAINYRLGTFGFLPHPELGVEASDGMSGQYGLMDQQAALLWVHDNIAAFGGDPERVTLLGGSSGGMSICAHLASPALAGTFRAGAILSGSCSAFALEEVEGYGVAFAEEVGCSEADPLTCLRQKAPEELAELDELGTPGGVVWGGSLLPEPPLQALLAGRTQRQALFIGGAEHEARAGRQRLFPRELGAYHEFVAQEFGEHAPEVLARYPAEEYADPFYAEMDVISDSSSAPLGPCINRSIARAHSAHAPVYVFEFADADAPMPPWVAASAPEGFTLGASHGSSEIYWFDRPQDATTPLSEAQWRLADTMVATLGRFAWTTNPSLPGAHLRWPRYDAARERVLRFEPDATRAVDDWAVNHQCEFWESIGYPGTGPNL